MVNGPMETDEPPPVCEVISAEVAPMSLHRLLDPACCIFDLRVYGEAINWMCRKVINFSFGLPFWELFFAFFHVKCALCC